MADATLLSIAGYLIARCPKSKINTPNYFFPVPFSTFLSPSFQTNVRSFRSSFWKFSLSRNLLPLRQIRGSWNFQRNSFVRPNFHLLQVDIVSGYCHIHDSANIHFARHGVPPGAFPASSVILPVEIEAR